MQMSSPIEISAAPETAPLQRARGRVDVAFALRRGGVRVERLFQQGCAKALRPRGAGTPEVVLINTSGGIAGGDRLDWRLEAGAGAALVASTQAAERVYRATGSRARVETRLALQAGATLDWLPQETILYDGARLDRRLEVEMAEDSRLTLLETVVLGRAAMGETLTAAHFTDQWRLRRGGRLIHAEALRLEGAPARGVATLGNARAFATLVHVAPGAEARLDAARALLADPGPVTAAVTSPREGVLILRFLAPDNAPLRALVIRFLMSFRAGPVPRVWSL